MANRTNALKSTGPTTESGKRRSRRNAVRHGLTAETVIGVLEDPEAYKAFELSITSEFDAQTAVERELVLRLASLLWRLRRAVAIESGLLQLQSEFPVGGNEARNTDARQPLEPLYRIAPHGDGPEDEDTLDPEPGDFIADDYNNQIARCFSQLAKVDHGAFKRLGRYETSLWRQIGQILFTLDALRWKTFSGRFLPAQTTEKITKHRKFRPWTNPK